MPLGSFRLNSLARYIAAIPPGPGPTGDTASKYIGFYGSCDVSTSQSKFGGSSISTGASAKYFVIQNHPDLVFGTNDFTIEFWIYFNDLGGFKIPLDGRTAANSAAPCFYTSSSTLNYFVSATTVITGTVSTGTWTHVAVSRSSGSTRMFIDGTQVGSTWSDSTNYILNTEGLYFSKDAAESTPGVDGYYDEIRISKVARYTSNFTAPAAAFVWDSDTAVLIHADSFNGSRTAYDDNGGRQAINLSEPTSSSVAVSDTQSKFGDSSLYFPGTDGSSMIGSVYRDNPSALPIELVKWYNNPGWTLEYWFYTTNMDSLTPNDTTSGGGLVGQRYDNVDPGGQWWGFGPRRDGEVRFTAFAGPHRNFVTSSAGITANNWHHIAFVFDYGTSVSDSTVSIYVNGVNKFSQTVGSDGPYIAGDDNTNGIIGFAIGYTGTVAGDNFQGYVDELRVSKVPRYTANFTPAATAFANDADTVLLMHGEGPNGSKVFRDDNSRLA